MNIQDEAPQFNKHTKTETTHWESLTVWERNVELFFTPQLFEYDEEVHSPFSEDLGETIIDDDGERFHFFYPLEHDDEYNYAFEFEESDQPFTIIRHKVPLKKSETLKDLDKKWEDIPQRIAQARLLSSINNDVFFFFR